MIVQNSLQKKVKVFGLERPNKSGSGATCIGFWWIFVFDQEQERFISYRFLTEHFNERVFSSVLSPHSHVILYAGLARSCRIHCLMIAKKTFSLRKRCSPLRMRGEGKSSSSVLNHLLRRAFPGGQGWSFGWWILQLHPIVDSSVKTVSSKIR